MITLNFVEPEKRRHENSAKVKYLISFSVCDHRSSLFRVFCRVDLSHVSSSIHRYVFQLREVRGLALSPLRGRKEVEKTGFPLCCKVCPLFTRLFLLLYGKMNVFHFPMSDWSFWTTGFYRLLSESQFQVKSRLIMGSLCMGGESCYRF